MWLDEKCLIDHQEEMKFLLCNDKVINKWNRTTVVQYCEIKKRNIYKEVATADTTPVHTHIPMKQSHYV